MGIFFGYESAEQMVCAEKNMVKDIDFRTSTLHIYTRPVVRLVGAHYIIRTAVACKMALFLSSPDRCCNQLYMCTIGVLECFDVLLAVFGSY